MSARPQLLVKVDRVVEAKCSRSWIVWGVLPVHSVIFSVHVFCARSLSLCEDSLSLCIVPRKMPQGSKGHSLVLHWFQRTFGANPSPIALHKLRSAFSICQACKSLVWVINGYSSALKMQNKDWLGWVHRTLAPQEKEENVVHSATCQETTFTSPAPLLKLSGHFLLIHPSPGKRFIKGDGAGQPGITQVAERWRQWVV